MTELKLAQLMTLAGGSGSCGRDKGGSPAPQPGPSKSHGSKCS